MRTMVAVRRGRAGWSKAGVADIGAAHEDGCVAFRYEAAGRGRGQERLTRTGRAAARTGGSARTGSGENGASRAEKVKSAKLAK